ncbi:MAG: rhomboid family intrarane serine protease [Sphingobacteriaceae bacterium]|jgi:rhomboid-like protein|nr:rhomboid family intrarane serine protease [Sphingobacteriaceae bacterium]
MNSYRPSPFANIPPVTKNLLIINVIFFIATLLFQRGNESPLIEWLGVYYPASPKFKIWQIITYMFMHGGFFHIMFNMFALFSFGPSLEYLMGSKRFFNFYLLTGIGALVLQMVVQGVELYQIAGTFSVELSSFQSNNPDDYRTIGGIYLYPMVGASGAICGLLAAFGLLFPNIELMLIFLPIPIKAKYFIPFYLLAELSMGVYKIPGDSIAHFAHLGGAIFGFILVKAWGLKRPGGYV